MSFLVLAVLFYGNRWWDSSVSGSSQSSVVFSSMSPPPFSELFSKDKTLGSFLFVKLLQSSGWSQWLQSRAILSSTSVKGIYTQCVSLLRDDWNSPIGEQPGGNRVKKKKRNPTMLHGAQPVVIKTQFKDLFTQENISGLFQAVTLQLTWHFTNPKVLWMNSSLRFGILLELGTSWNSSSLYMFLEIIPTRQVHMF